MASPRLSGCCPGRCASLNTPVIRRDNSQMILRLTRVFSSVFGIRTNRGGRRTSHRCLLLFSRMLSFPVDDVRETRTPERSRTAGRAARRRVNALLAEWQMVANMLRRLGKHWQIHPQSLSGCQLEDTGVFGVPIQEAERSWKVRDT